MAVDLFAQQQGQPQDLFATAGIMPQQAAGQQPSLGVPQQISRGLGLGVRDLVEGGLSPFTMAANGLGYLYNKGADLVEGQRNGYRFPDQAQAVSNELTKLGVPQPETPLERISGDIGSTVSGAGSGIAAGGLLAKATNPVIQGIGSFLNSSAPQQVAAGALSGAGSGVARESGMSGPAQLGLGLAAGSLPFLLSPESAINAANLSQNPSRAQNALAQAVGVTTGVGGSPLVEAFRVGKAGGEPANIFQENLRGKVQPQDILNQAKAALSDLKMAKNAQYRSGMADLSKDQTVLSFEPIDQALAKANSIGTFKGIDLSPNTAAARNDVQSLVKNWKTLPPAEYHTPEGLDALKQQIGDLREKYGYGTQSNVIVNNAYNAVKDSIQEQAPTYAKTMANYQAAADEINNIQKTLSLNPKATVDTALRKLQSTMRDNVNTNYGSRADLVRALDKNGDTLMPALAGQTLNSWVPRSIARLGLTAEGLGLGALALHDPGQALMALPSLAVTSPRVMGEAAYYAGKASPAINAATRRTFSTGALPLLLQSTRTSAISQ